MHDAYASEPSLIRRLPAEAFDEEQSKAFTDDQRMLLATHGSVPPNRISAASVVAKPARPLTPRRHWVWRSSYGIRCEISSSLTKDIVVCDPWFAVPSIRER